MLRLAAVAVVAGALATGCTGSPAPTPSTPTPLSDDEAFAAAEATYRAYVDAVNARREDPMSQPDPQTFLIGEALEADIETQRQLDQAGLHLVGPTRIVSIARGSVSSEGEDVALTICLDSSEGRVVNANGEDVTPPDRESQPGLAVDFTRVDAEYKVTKSSSAIEPC